MPISRPRPRRLARVAAALAVSAAVVASGATIPAAYAADPADLGATVYPTVDAFQATSGSTTLTPDARIVLSADQRTSKQLGTIANDTVPRAAGDVGNVAQVFARDLTEVSDLDLPVGTGTPRPGDISFTLVDSSTLPAASQLGSDGYHVTIGDGVTIEASTTAGLYNGGRSILQALRTSPDHTLRNGSAVDVPGQAARVYTIDVSREFWSVDELSDVIRQMGWSKQNILILHFDDAEYFRLNSAKYPGLADPTISYDRDDIRTLVDVGHENNVTVVPAFEYPAHVTHKADYFHIGMADGPLEVTPGFGTRDTGATAANTCGDAYTYSHLTPSFTMNFMNPKAMRVSKEMLDEFLPWFDSPWVHLGGDELPSGLNNCPALKTWMSQQTDPHLKSLVGIQQDFISQLANYVTAEGKRPIAYNGFETMLPAGEAPSLPKNVIIQMWTGNDSVASLQGYDRIVGKKETFYFAPTVTSYIYPKLDDIWSDTRNYRADDPHRLGVGMHWWGDSLAWAKADYLESLVYTARAVTAERAWNPTPDPSLTLDAFRTDRLEKVGAAPWYRGEHPQGAPSTDSRPIHDWNTSDTNFAPGSYDAHRKPNSRRSITDVCNLSGMTGINLTTLQVTNDPVMGTVQGGTLWNLGAASLDGPWTFAANVKFPTNNTTGNLLSVLDDKAYERGQDGKLTLVRSQGVFLGTGSRTVGVRVDSSTVLSFPYSVPTNTWTKLVFVNDGKQTTLYANGTAVGTVAASPQLPLGKLGGNGVTLQSAQVYAQALSPAEIAKQASTPIPVIPPANCRTAVPAPPLPRLTSIQDFTPKPTEEPTTDAPTPTTDAPTGEPTTAAPTEQPTTAQPTGGSTSGGSGGETATGPTSTAGGGSGGPTARSSKGAGAGSPTATASRSAAVRLPRTGAEIAPIAILAAGLVLAGAGALIVRHRRRR